MPKASNVSSAILQLLQERVEKIRRGELDRVYQRVKLSPKGEGRDRRTQPQHSEQGNGCAGNRLESSLG
jgi:hypothetical protein